MGKIPRESRAKQPQHARYDKVRKNEQDACEIVTEKAKAKLGELFGSLALLTDPDEQTIRFFQGIADGMPARESAKFFLHCDDDERFSRIMANPEAGAMVRHLEGSVAREQYRKVCRDGGPREALEWLRSHRAEQWRERKQFDINELPTETVIAILEADAARGASAKGS